MINLIKILINIRHPFSPNLNFFKVSLAYFEKLQIIIYNRDKFEGMGTSMTVPESVHLRLARKILEQNDNKTTNKITLERGENILDKLTNLSIKVEGANLSPDKMKDLPQTAITEQIRTFMPTNDIQQKQIDVAAIQIKERSESKENNQHSIWQNMTEQTKNHFKRVDERRKKAINAFSSLDPPSKRQQLSNISQCLNKDKIPSQVHSDKANQLFLSINSKFGYKPQNLPNKQTDPTTFNPIAEEDTGRIVKKKILLPNVQIVNPIKEKKKLKYIYQDEETTFNHDKNWRATS